MTAISEPDTMALAVTGVTKHYDSGFALDDVTFDLPKGYIMGLIGPNGAGKSTLIKLILNMIRRGHGSIQVLGLDNIIDEEAVKEQLGVVFDSSYLYEQWKVSKVERIVAPLYPAWNGERYRRYLDDFGLGGAQNGKKKIRDLSRGMQMKLMLAIALSHDAKLLILDEPTSGLDVLARDELMDMLHAYIEDGEHSVLFSTHITADLERAADFITYITGGRLYYTGPKDEFEESFRIVKGGPDELAQLPAGVVLGSHTYQTGFDALVRSDSLGTVSAAVADIVVEPASIDDIIRLTNARDSVVSSPEAASALKEVGHGNVD
ncbi:ABC transporter ATP-binding protein [Bifidobacterium bifidum]|uniref:ABC transporter ATP-binding protein n=1 Tax=Bifidobacterium bifidum TaxID=1681 RepID=UPI0012ABD377|nr:ABC transporter ATP-binding protein [Bifidobacterium bifidum]